MRRIKLLIPAAALLAALGCDDDDDELGDGSVVGRVEATTQPFANVVPVAFAPQQVGPGTTVTAAVVGAFESNGNLQVLASGDVGADARFRVNGVPALLTRLVAEVRDDSGDAVGRSIVHFGPGEGQVVPVAAINGETTAEANVFGELRARGNAAGSISTIEISAKIDFQTDALGREAAVSDVEIDALADAFTGAEAAFLEALARLGATVDAGDLQAAGDDAARLFAALRDEGTDEQEAEIAFLTALAEEYAEAGVDLDAQSQAGSAATAAGQFEAGTEISLFAILNGIGTQMGAARALLAIDALTDLGASATSTQAVANAYAQLDADLAAATSVTAILDAFDTFQDELLDVLGDVVTAQLGLSGAVFTTLVAAVENAAFQAALVAALSAATDTDAFVDAYLTFYQALRDLVVSTLTTAGVAAADAELVADVFVAADTGVDAIF
ncbi:MAG TPA: hypothetical protein VF158_16375 [Longimicrobiales bacterium]